MGTYRRYFPITLLALCVLASTFLLGGIVGQDALSWRTCTGVIDGDTIILNGNETVRLIGVDTPETKDPRKPVQYFGKEACDFTRKLVEGKKVQLVYENQRIDKYGRTLAYVYLEDGTHVNAQIVLQGYGHAYTEFPFRHIDEFRFFERTARERKAGLWGSGPETEEAPLALALSGQTGSTKAKRLISKNLVDVYVTDSGTKYHRAGCSFLSKSSSSISLSDAINKGYEPCSRCRPQVVDLEGNISDPLIASTPQAELSRPTRSLSGSSASASAQNSDFSDGTMVYVTSSGTKYHRAGCSYLSKSSSSLSLKSAIDKGYGPCSRCRPPTRTPNGEIVDPLLTSAPQEETSKVPSTPATSSVSSSSSSGRTIYTGPRGGRYYINSKGKKVYVKKK